MKLTEDIALLLTLKVNSKQQLSHMEPDSAVCVNFSGANGYLRDENSVLSKPMLGYEPTLSSFSKMYCSKSSVFRILFIAIGGHQEP